MNKFGVGDSATRICTGVDYRINTIANFGDFYGGIAIDKKDHPYYHCIPIDGGESVYIPERLLEKPTYKD